MSARWRDTLFAGTTLLVLGFLSLPIAAQTNPANVTPANETGVKPYETYGGVRENINLATGNLSLTIPLLTIPGRNGHNFLLAASYDSKIWQLQKAYIVSTGDYVYWWASERPAGGGVRVPFLWYQVVTIGTGAHCRQNYVLLLPDGTKISFPKVQSDCVLNGVPQGGTMPNVGSSNDGTFALLDASSSVKVVHFTDGSKLSFDLNGPLSYEDSNGNTISFNRDANNNYTGWSDTAGHLVAWTFNGSGYTFPITYKDSNGATQTINSCQVNCPTNPALSPTFVNPPDAGTTCASPCSANEPNGYTLPNGLGYTLTYNNFGELTKITYPTGGYTRYDWGLFTATDKNTALLADFREVVAKHVCTKPSGSCSPSDEQTTTYTPTITGSNNSQNVVVDPLGNQTIVSFVNSSGATWMYETSRKIYQQTTTLLRTVQTDYTAICSSIGGIPIVFPIRKTTTLDDGEVTKVEWDYDTYGTCPIDNVIERREYTYGAGAPGALARKTDNTWLKTNSVNGQDYTSTAIYILRRKATEKVYGASNNLLAQTQYEYDSYTAGVTASNAVQHDSSFNTNYTTRGNRTASQRWRNTDGVWLTTRNQYDDAGNILSTTDPLGHATTFSYADSWGNAGCLPSGGNAAAYRTSTTDALGHIAKSTYNSCTGTRASTTDPNNQVTTFAYDAMNRLIQTNFPDGGQTTFAYNELSLPLSFTAAKKISGSMNLVTTAVVEGIGNVTQTQLNSDPDGVTYVDTTYDALERKASLSNPYRTASDPGPTNGTTTFTYDALSRATQVTQPDGSVVTTQYCGSATKVTDEAGHWRRSLSDPLGRLIEVDEPNSSTASAGACPATGDPVAVTTYSYDALNNLTQVLQSGSRQRTFSYNSLSQLTQSVNPESGTVTYVYDNDGNLSNKTAPAPNQAGTATVTLTYCYDALNRLTQKGYTAQTCTNGSMPSPAATYSYDQGQASAHPVGRRTAMTDAGGSQTWTYDSMGRPATDQRVSNGVTKTTTYTYNTDGSLATLTYPSGRVITYTPSSAGRMVSAVDTANSINYATNAHYTPGGALTSVLNGAALNTTDVYDSRLQPCWMYATTGTALPWNTTNCSGIAATGNILDLKYNFSLGSGDNGNVMGITNNRDTTRSQTFGYDQLNRIAAAQTTSTSSTSATHCWGETFGYDAWANLLTIGAVSSSYGGCTQESLSVTVTTSNQISGYTYDAAGDLTATPAPGAASYSYNAENQLTNANGTGYVYDGDGRRVEKASGKLYWYGMGNVLDETDLTGSTTNGSFNEYVYFDGKRVARRDSSNNIFYYFEDHLGTSRTIVQSGQTAPCYDADFYAFGGERTPIVNTCPQNYKFTGKERDSESGLDNFGARYMGSSLGRFMAPDIGAFHLENPQSLNRYAYALNNPLFYVDPDGEDSISGVYRLGTASVNTFVESGQSVDNVALLASLAGPSFVPLSNMEQDQSTISGGSGSFSRYIPFPNAESGGCVLGCSTIFNEVPVGISLSLSFSYDDKTGQVTGANIQLSIDAAAPFIGPNPPAQRAAFQPLPGIAPGPEIFSVRIDANVLKKLSPQQLQALKNATSPSNLINDAIRQAVLQEQKRRAEEQRKKEEERKKKCQQDGKKDCA